MKTPNQRPIQVKETAVLGLLFLAAACGPGESTKAWQGPCEYGKQNTFELYNESKADLVTRHYSAQDCSGSELLTLRLRYDGDFDALHFSEQTNGYSVPLNARLEEAKILSHYSYSEFYQIRENIRQLCDKTLESQEELEITKCVDSSMQSLTGNFQLQDGDLFLVRTGDGNSSAGMTVSHQYTRIK